VSSGLPTITDNASIIPYLKLWQTKLNQVVKQPNVPRSPFNFQAAGGAAGSQSTVLNWEPVPGADGYEIQSASDGNFTLSLNLIPITSGVQTSYFDSVGATSTARYYRIRATAGTSNQPQVTKGTWSAPIIGTTGGGTTYDNVSSTSGNGGWNPPGGSRIGVLRDSPL
jgi:hypothetical protein